MKTIKRIILLLIVFMMAIILKENTVFAEYVIQVVPTSTDNPAWTSISASDAYDACQNLNQTYSTLGTTALKGHLITNADWYAVSLLTYSAYGTKNAGNTTGNKTGIMNFGYTNTFTASLMEGATRNSNIASIYDNLGTPYVESVKNNTNRELNEIGRGLLSSEYLATGYGKIYYDNTKNYPICSRSNLFGFSLGTDQGNGGYYQYYAQGIPKAGSTFRPVIWNK